MEDRAEQARQQARARRRRIGRRVAGAAAVDAARDERRVVFAGRFVTDQAGLLADDRHDAPVAQRKQAAEVIHDFVRVETDGLRVVAHEGAREDPLRPARKVVALEALPELDADVGNRRDGFERNAAALAFAAEAWAKRIPFGHGGYPRIAILAPEGR